MQGGALDALDGDVEVVGQALRGAAIALDSPQGLAALPERIPQLGEPWPAAIPIRLGQIHGFGQADNQGHWQGARPQSPFVTASVLLGGELDPGADREGTDAFGAIELVPAEAEQIEAGWQGHMPDRLGSIAVDQHLPLPAELNDGLHRLEDADLVVGGHNAHQQRLRAQGLLQLVEVDPAVGLGRQTHQLKAMPRQVAHRIEDGPVFGGQADQAPAGAAPPQLRLRDPLDRQVVGFTGAAAEDQRLRAEAQARRDGAPGVLHDGGRG